MLELTVTVASIDSEHVTLTNVKKCAYYDFPDQYIPQRNWSSRIANVGCVIGFNADVKTYQLCAIPTGKLIENRLAPKSSQRVGRK